MTSVLTIFAIVGSFVLGVIFSEMDTGCIRRKLKPGTSQDRVRKYGYDSESPMGKVFQKRAGISTRRRKFDLRYM